VPTTFVRLEKGCNSLENCRKLVDDGIDRFRRCQNPEPDAFGGRHAARCTQECYDMVVAWDTAYRWIKEHRVSTNSVSDPEPESYPHCG
jgi:hypothetical protein